MPSEARVLDTENREPEQKLLRAALLLDVYGELLTERQREFMRLHFEDDLSFSEIAREFGISRQAVHDSVKHAIQSLERFEEVLRLLDRADNAPTLEEPHIGGRQLVERLASLRDRVRQEAEAGSAGWVARELDGLILQLGGEPAAG